MGYFGTQWGTVPLPAGRLPGHQQHRTRFCTKAFRIGEKGETVFVGQYEHALDDKGRVVLPSPFRAFVADRGYITQLDGCLGLWSADEFRLVAEKWKAESAASRISMRVFRKLMNSVREVKLDSAGRITLPRELLDALGFDSQVVVSGLYDRVEIWPAETYAQDLGSDDADEELAEAVARLGL